EDTPVTTNVVANDTDVDGTVVSSAVAIVNGPSNGSVVNNGDGTVTYTPNANFNGSDSFTYTVKDNGGATSNVAIVTINIGAVNDPPVAQMDSEITDENMPVTIPVLANDSDPDGDRLTVESVTQPSNGTVTNNGTDVTYSPDPDSNGMDTFTYTVSDKNGGADTTTVMVAVAVVNDPPVAQEDSAIIDENMPVTIPVLANDSDPDGDRLTVESVTRPSNGTVTNNGTDVTYSPDPDFDGMDTFTYTVSDRNGSTDTARVSVEVLEGAADGEGGAYGPSEGKVKLGELVSQVRFVKRDTDNISWLVPGVPDLTVLEDSMVLEKLALSTDLQPTRYRAGAHLEVGVELPTMEERRAHGWPWIRVTSPDLAEPGNVTAGFSFSGRSADGIYWFGIDIGDVPWGRYDFWIVYGEEKMILVPIIVSP
ncbi:tandem-95 repeat protein, partial [Candidatus Bipolaricaulota bacterium]|nr:tandem-95 repeat protein [Candidatus Bipolaricaulota bacterium]